MKYCHNRPCRGGLPTATLDTHSQRQREETYRSMKTRPQRRTETRGFLLSWKQGRHSFLSSLCTSRPASRRRAVSARLLMLRNAHNKMETLTAPHRKWFHMLKQKREQMGPNRHQQPYLRKLFSWKWQPTPVYFLGKLHGQEEPGGLESMGCKELDMTEQLTHADDLTFFSLLRMTLNGS